MTLVSAALDHSAKAPDEGCAATTSASGPGSLSFVRPTAPYDDVKAPKKPKEPKPVKAINAKTGGHRFPKNVDEGLRDFARHDPCLVAGHPLHPRCELTEKKDRATGEHFYGCDPAHIDGSQGKGVHDHDHIVSLCRLAHREQQGRSKEFQFRYRVNLKRAARQTTARYLGKVKHG